MRFYRKNNKVSKKQKLNKRHKKECHKPKGRYRSNRVKMKNKARNKIMKRSLKRKKTRKKSDIILLQSIKSI
jgi:hypothetical protein